MSSKSSALRQILRKEVGLLAGLLFVGIVLMPVGIYWIGQAFFGSYGGYGFGQFFGDISEKIRGGDGVAWFLVLAPYLVWQALRATVKAWRRLGKTA